MTTVRKLPETIKRMAIAHMIGQMQDMKLMVKTSDIAVWLGCSKQTAAKYLHKMECDGLVHKRVEGWRGQSSVYFWKLTKAAYHIYNKNVYIMPYNTVLEIKVGA